jgi:hypothetical protein
MNFDDDDNRQRAIGAGSDSLDQKIAASPSPFSVPKKKKRNRQVTTDAEVFTIFDADVLCGRGEEKSVVLVVLEL